MFECIFATEISESNFSVKSASSLSLNIAEGPLATGWRESTVFRSTKLGKGL